MKSDQISIKAFRGFQDERRIPLSPALTVIYGENERGKTSLCEGCHWLFTNELLEGRDPQSELRSAEANIHVDSGPRVRFLDEEQGVLVERSNEGFQNPAGLPTNTSPALLQYRLQQVLYTTQGDRRKFFEQVMELDMESDFSQKLRRACNDLDPLDHEAWSEWCGAVEAAQRQSFVPPYPSPNNSDEQKENEHSLFKFLAEYFGCDPKPDSIEQAISSPSEEKEKEFPVDDIIHSVPESIVDNINETLSTIDDIDREAERAFERTKWLEEGLELAEPPVCPFCTENTADESKLESISQQIENTKQRNRAHREAKSSLSSTVTTILPLATVDAEQTIACIETLRGNISEEDVEVPDELIRKLDDLQQALDQLAEDRPSAPEDLDDELMQPEVFKEFAPTVMNVSRMWLKLIPQLETLKENLEKKRARADYLECASLILRYERTDIKQLYLRLDAGAALNQIGDAAPRAANRLKEKRLRNLADDIMRFYGILRPYSPTPLEEIQIAGGVRGDVRIKARSIDQVEHASKIFSFSNANALGMAAHIARVLDAGHQTVVLDDPFQSLDDTNKQQIIEDLVEELITEDIQVVIVTHHRDAAQKLLNMYAENGAIGNALRWDDQEGAIPERMYPSGDSQLRIILDGLERDRPSEIPKVADALRQLIESFCADYLKELGEELPPSRRRSLGSFIAKLEGLSHDVRPNAMTLENLNRWNKTLSGEIHDDIRDKLEDDITDGTFAPGMDQLKGIAIKAIKARKHEKQLKPPDVANWKQPPRSQGIQKRCNSILGVS